MKQERCLTCLETAGIGLGQEVKGYQGQLEPQGEVRMGEYNYPIWSFVRTVGCHPTLVKCVTRPCNDHTEKREERRKWWVMPCEQEETWVGASLVRRTLRILRLSSDLHLGGFSLVSYFQMFVNTFNIPSQPAPPPAVSAQTPRDLPSFYSLAPS